MPGFWETCISLLFIHFNSQYRHLSRGGPIFFNWPEKIPWEKAVNFSPMVEIDESKISKSELKARKAMAKLGLKAVPEINRVVIRRLNNSLYVIETPDVYKTANSETHIIFGNAKIEDVAAQQAAAQKLLGASSQQQPSPQAIPEEEEIEDETGIEANDIDMVMSQANVTRAKAVRALKV